MIVLHAGDPLPKSIFLAGPTPRGPQAPSWRPAALDMLRAMGFSGTALVPERQDWSTLAHYDDQIHWEWEGLSICTAALFWVPRDIELMPAFTTNVEFGMLASGSKAVLAYPADAPKMRYLDALARRHGVEVLHSLEEGLRAAMAKAEHPFGAAA